MGRKSNYVKLLLCSIASALMLSTTFCTSICKAEQVTIGWDANSESDLEGYVVYRNSGSSGAPYQFSGTLPEKDLSDPEKDLSDPLNPMVTLTGLKAETAYYVAVTAYDTLGNESSFSDELCIKIIDKTAQTCSAKFVPSGSKQSGGGGGGGGGGFCFISTVYPNVSEPVSGFFFLP